MSMVEAITMFCKRNKLRVIYEFIDNNQILEALMKIASFIHFLKDLIFFQGYYLHIPNAFEEEYKKITNPNQKDGSEKV